MKKPELATKSGESVLSSADPDAFKKSPGTRAFFLSPQYDGEGGDRLPGRLTLSNDGTRWTASLKEPSSCTQLYLAAQTLSDLWRLVEAALSDDRTPWQADAYAMERRPKKRK